MTRGVVWLEDVHYNACKTSDQCNHTFAWDNLGFDGPTPYRDYTFDAQDALQALGGGGTNLGYQVGPAPVTLQVPNVHWVQDPSTVLIGLNWFPDQPIVPSVSVNGNPAHTVVWPFDPETSGWRTIGIQVPLSEIKRDATNTVTISAGQAMVVSNVNIILLAAAPVPPT